MRRSALILLLTLVAPRGHATPPPWQRTETREPCANFSALRNPYFGDLHIHTRFSADAYIYGTRVTPRDAYTFATGGAIPFSDDDEMQTRSASIDRPLDFAGVTDHSEFYGEVRVCSTVGSSIYDSDICRLLRQVESPADQFLVTAAWLFPAGIASPAHLQLCTEPGIDCTASMISVWGDIQAAAEEFYDRTAACGFTTFIGYEYTASPVGTHLHRNIIFRNHHVPPTVSSVIETRAGGIPQGFWTAIEDTCLNAGTGCDAVIIPHNSNLSGGKQFFDPADANEALRRQLLEPLVEMHQIKGNSECRFDRLARTGAGTEDELCSFEQVLEPDQSPATTAVPIASYPKRNLVRNMLKDGLAFEQRLGVNPFRMGFIGSTDNHDGAAGSTAERNWAGGSGNSDSSPARQIRDGMRGNPGGLAVAWAEENSRDAIFSAFKRRETYATSGTRPVVRFFGGELTDVECGSPDFLHNAYATGTPMGGELGPVRGGKSPRFAVWAAKDPGTADAPGTDLQRIQIVKGWVDKKGGTHERVFDVAGDAKNGASVDPATCTPTGAGSRELCKVWRDPTFKRQQRAFYYARVLENPTCRWSTLVCKAAGIDPLSANCASQAATVGNAFANCCLGPGNDAFIDPLVQERAWTSSIWYRPEGIAKLRAEIRYGAQPGTDRLTMRVALGATAKALDPRRTDIELRVSDDDDILHVTIPAGTLARKGKRYVLKQPLGPLETLSLVLGKRAELRVTTAATDLSAADQTEHPVTIALNAGVYRVAHTRLWQPQEDRLVPEGK